MCGLLLASLLCCKNHICSMEGFFGSTFKLHTDPSLLITSPLTPWSVPASFPAYWKTPFTVPLFSVPSLQPCSTDQTQTFWGRGVNHIMPWLGTSWLDFLFGSHFTYISKVRGFCLSFLRLYSNYFISPCLFQIHSLQIHSLLSLIVITYICIGVCVCITGIF